VGYHLIMDCYIEVNVEKDIRKVESYEDIDNLTISI
jgi:hypothetical protein